MIKLLRIAGGQDHGFAGYYRNRTKMTFVWGLGFAGQALGLLQTQVLECAAANNCDSDG
jgi:hypothetical protein